MTTAPVGRAPLPTPVLEIGGTHVTAALVHLESADVALSAMNRRPLDSRGDSDAILDAIASVANALPPGHDSRWGVAVPGPFEHETGIGRFDGMGKLESLSGVNVGAGLRDRLGRRAEQLHFVNDADAFALGEYHRGAAAGHARALCLTLGTGVGSSFMSRGRPIHTGSLVPPDGRAHRLTVHGRPLEETVSRQGLRHHYARLSQTGSQHVPDVQEIAERARRGDSAALEVFRSALDTLARVLGPWIGRFEATVVVIGGAMARSWDLVEPPLRAGLTSSGFRDVPVLPAHHPDEAPLLGAAYAAVVV